MEYLGSTKAKSAGFWAFSAGAGVGETAFVATGVTGAKVTGAEASTSFGAAPAATDFAAGAV